MLHFLKRYFDTSGFELVGGFLFFQFFLKHISALEVTVGMHLVGILTLSAVH